jgi:hypothetical protein
MSYIVGQTYNVVDGKKPDDLGDLDYICAVTQGKYHTVSYPEVATSIAFNWEDMDAFLYKGRLELFKPHPVDRTVVFTPDSLEKRQVVTAANNYNGVIVLGVRHFCPLMRYTLHRFGIKGSSPHEQGFVDQWGNFMDRKEALVVLKTNGKFIRDDDYLDELYSENLH